MEESTEVTNARRCYLYSPINFGMLEAELRWRKWKESQGGRYIARPFRPGAILAAPKKLPIRNGSAIYHTLREILRPPSLHQADSRFKPLFEERSSCL